MIKKVTHNKNMYKKDPDSIHKEKIGTKIMEKKAKEKGKKISETKKEIKKKNYAQLRRDEIEKIELQEKKNPTIVKKFWAPTKFQERFAKDMLEYFEKKTDWWYFEEYTEEVMDGRWVPHKKINKRVKPIPTFEWYALSIWIDHHTLRRRAVSRDEKGILLHKDFCSSYKRCLGIQEKMIKELSLTWHYNSNIAKLLLWADHEVYETKEENDQTEKWKQLEQINSMNIDDNLQNVLTKS